MEEIKTVPEISAWVRSQQAAGHSIGLVPTMGYLHDGHKSLIEQAVAQNDRVVVSVFVNPLQFGPKEDLATYPRDAARDDRLCAEAGVAVVFRPEADEMYPPGFCTFVDMTGLTDTLCGASRPGHFRGVCTVVNKLLGIVTPDRAYFGEKDAQQLAVIRRMATDLNIGTDIIGCPIVREADGLAMSSRNTYLSAEERRAALRLSQALAGAKAALGAGERNAGVLKGGIRREIEAEPLAKIDYVELVDANTLQPVARADGPVLCAIAVFIGATRLIDNFFWTDT